MRKYREAFFALLSTTLALLDLAKKGAVKSLSHPVSLSSDLGFSFLFESKIPPVHQIH